MKERLLLPVWAGLRKGRAMKHRKTFGPLVLSIAAFLILPGSVWGTELTSPTGTVSTPTIKLESEGYATLDTKISNTAWPADCQWVFEGAVESHGDGKPSIIPLSSLAITGCTKNWHATVVSPGSLEISWTSGYDGTVTWNGGTIELTYFGVPCRYTAENTHLGTLVGGSPATLKLEGLLTRHEFTSPFCGQENRAFTGSVSVVTPESLFVDKSGTTLTSPTGTDSTPTIKAESEGHVGIDHPIATIQCEWGLEGTVESHEGRAVLPLSGLTTSGCTDSWHGTTVSAGKLEISSTSGYNGTVRWSGGTVEMTRLGTTCRFRSENTDLGTITGGSPATVHLEGKLLPDGGSPLCGEEAYSLTGSFKVASPSSLFVDKNS